MLKSKSLHYFLSKLFHVFISVCLIFFNIFTARAETFFSLLSEKKVLLSTDRCEEVVIFRDTGAIVELSSSHCLRNERRISHFPGAFYLLKYFSKIVFLSMVRFFLVTISDFRAHPISSAGPSSSNDICIYIYIYIYIYTHFHSQFQERYHRHASVVLRHFLVVQLFFFQGILVFVTVQMFF